MKIAILHPGEMGATIGAAAVKAGARVLWASEGRSPATRTRAEGYGFEDRCRLGDLLRTSQVVISVCPPDAALAQANDVARFGFAGLYIDANAISPKTALKIRKEIEAGGACFVDGCIIGPPVRTARTTRLFLCGERAESAAALFRGSLLEAVPFGVKAGSASALKMCYAAYTKGSAALLLATRAAASAYGVDAMLTAEWSRLRPGLEAASEDAVTFSAAKAWRFVGEMGQVAETFAVTGLPDGFHKAAAEVYDRLGYLKDVSGGVKLDDVVDALNRGGSS